MIRGNTLFKAPEFLGKGFCTILRWFDWEDCEFDVWKWGCWNSKTGALNNNNNGCLANQNGGWTTNMAGLNSEWNQHRTHKNGDFNQPFWIDGHVTESIRLCPEIGYPLNPILYQFFSSQTCNFGLLTSPYVDILKLSAGCLLRVAVVLPICILWRFPSWKPSFGKRRFDWTAGGGTRILVIYNLVNWGW